MNRGNLVLAVVTAALLLFTPLGTIVATLVLGVALLALFGVSTFVNLPGMSWWATPGGRLRRTRFQGNLPLVNFAPTRRRR